MPGKASFWDKHATGYAKRSISNMEAYEKKLQQTQEYLHPEAEVFEFGCGTGTTALHHASLVKRIVAIDVSAKMLEIAKEKAAKSGVENVVFQQGAIETYDDSGQAFDMVMAHSILHLVDDRVQVINKVHGMLKPGGVFVSSTACLKDVMPWLRLVLPIGHFFGLLPDVRFFSPAELTKDIETAGFDIQVQWQPSKSQGFFVIAKKL